MSPSTPSPPPQILTAALAISETLQYIPHALVGGAAYSLLGSPCSVDSIEIVVPRGQTVLTRNTLRKDSGRFAVDARTRHTHFQGAEFNVEIGVVAPPGLFKGKFEAGTRVVRREGVGILHPVFLLDELCGVMMERVVEGKREEDAADILFLLNWLGENEERIRWSEVPNVTRAFAASFVERHGGVELWRKVCSYLCFDGGRIGTDIGIG